MTQDYVARKFIFSMLAGQIDTLRPLFEDDVQPYVTVSLIEGLRSQASWLYNMIGGDFEELQTARPSDSAFLREYRLANESNKRSPLIVVQVAFSDSTSTRLIGAQVKSFLAVSEKRLAGEQTWKIKSQDFDIQSVILVEVDTGYVVAVKFYDESTDTLTNGKVADVGIPIVQEAIARGYLDSARTLAAGKPVMEMIGAVFIRKDPLNGFSHIRVGFSPEDYAPAPDTGKSKKVTGTPTEKSPPKKK